MLKSACQNGMMLILLSAAPPLFAQGPPFQTDDPVPVDFQNYEFYVFGAVSSAPTEIDPVGPAFDRKFQSSVVDAYIAATAKLIADPALAETCTAAREDSTRFSSW
jgi:hypothetical protein